jgi:hypothetical protein
VGAGYTALVTFWALRHFEQTFTLFTPPLWRIFMECRFGSHRRFVCRTEWLIEWPVAGPLPHMLHRAAMTLKGSMA